MIYFLFFHNFCLIFVEWLRIIDDVGLQVVVSVRDLGVTIDAELNSMTILPQLQMVGLIDYLAYP